MFDIRTFDKRLKRSGIGLSMQSVQASPIREFRKSLIRSFPQVVCKLKIFTRTSLPESFQLRLTFFRKNRIVFRFGDLKMWKFEN